jgi:hypothetical protein
MPAARITPLETYEKVKDGQAIIDGVEGWKTAGCKIL